MFDEVHGHSFVKDLEKGVECPFVVKRQGPLEHANDGIVASGRSLGIWQLLHLLDEDLIEISGKFFL